MMLMLLESAYPLLYTLSPADWDKLNTQGEDTVIAAGPWLRGNITRPHRVVLRFLGDEFIVHDQIIPEDDSAAFFSEGHYVPPDEFERAWEVFVVRCHNRLGMHLTSYAIEKYAIEKKEER